MAKNDKINKQNSIILANKDILDGNQQLSPQTNLPKISNRISIISQQTNLLSQQTNLPKISHRISYINGYGRKNTTNESLNRDFKNNKNSDF